MAQAGLGPGQPRAGRGRGVQVAPRASPRSDGDLAVSRGPPGARSTRATAAAAAAPPPTRSVWGGWGPAAEPAPVRAPRGGRAAAWEGGASREGEGGLVAWWSIMGGGAGHHGMMEHHGRGSGASWEDGPPWEGEGEGGSVMLVHCGVEGVGDCGIQDGHYGAGHCGIQDGCHRAGHYGPGVAQAERGCPKALWDTQPTATPDWPQALIRALIRAGSSNERFLSPPRSGLRRQEGTARTGQDGPAGPRLGTGRHRG